MFLPTFPRQFLTSDEAHDYTSLLSAQTGWPVHLTLDVPPSHVRIVTVSDTDVRIVQGLGNPTIGMWDEVPTDCPIFAELLNED